MVQVPDIDECISEVNVSLKRDVLPTSALTVNPNYFFLKFVPHEIFRRPSNSIQILSYCYHGAVAFRLGWTDLSSGELHYVLDVGHF